MANTAKLLVTEGFMLKISVSFSYYIMPDFQQKDSLLLSICILAK